LEFKAVMLQGGGYSHYILCHSCSLLLQVSVTGRFGAFLLLSQVSLLTDQSIVLLLPQFYIYIVFICRMIWPYTCDWNGPGLILRSCGSTVVH